MNEATVYGVGLPAMMFGRPVVGNWNFDDDGGSQGLHRIYTLTGDVLVSIFGVCRQTLLGATATIEVGVAGDNDVIIPVTTATNLTNYEIWYDASPTATVEAYEMAANTIVVSNGRNIELYIGTADLTQGSIDFYCFWSPLASDGNVVAA